MSARKAKTPVEEPAEALVVEADITEASEPSVAQELEVVSGDTEITAPIQQGASAEITKDDLVLPTLRIVQRVGALAEQHEPGSIIVDGEEIISDGEQSVEVTVIEFQKCFTENVPWGAEKIPNVLFSEEAVHQLGLTTSWHEDEGERVAPDYWPTLHLRVLVKQPEGLEDSLHFPFNYGDDNYAMLAWTLQRSAYHRAGRRILSAFKFKIFQTPAEGFFRLTTKLQSFGANKAYVPDVTYGVKHPKDLTAWAESMK
mgnify:CR=1 FL=1